MAQEIVTNSFGIISYYKNGRIHREDGPATIYPSGARFWFIDGEYRWTDGPAVIWSDGSYEWYVSDRTYYTNKSYQEATGLSDEEMTILC